MDLVRLLIVDDHGFFVRSLMPPLEEEPSIDIVGVAASGDEALALIPRLRPDVVTMDLNMPYLSGLAAMERLEARGNLPGVLVLTGTDDPDQVWSAFGVGARGFLRKDQITDELLLSGIFTVAAGGIFLDPPTFSLLRTSFPAHSLAVRTEMERLAQLAPEDLTILRLVALGYENVDIGQHLHLTAKTVSNRLTGIYNVLNIPNRVAAATFALRAGLLNLNETSPSLRQDPS